MKLAIFTESIFHMSQTGRLYSPICQFIPFIIPLSDKFEKLTIVSRCKKEVVPPDDINYIDFGEKREFVGLPYYNNTEEFYKKSIYLVPKCFPIIKRVIDGNDVIIIRIHHTMAMIIACLAKKQNKPLVLYWAGPPITDLVRQNYPSRSFRCRTAKIIGEMQQRNYRRLTKYASMNLFIDKNEFKIMGSPERTRWVVPNFVSEDKVKYKVKPRNDQILKVTFVGRLYKHKGIHDLLESIKLLLQNNLEVYLYIVGDGPEKEKLESIVYECKFTENIKFYGNLPHKSVQKIISESHLLALPSYAEGLPKVLWEAWAKSVAVITTDVGSIGNYVKDKYNGMIVKPGKVIELANAIKRLEKDDDLRVRIAKRGYLLAMEHSWEKEIENIAFAINEAACSK